MARPEFSRKDKAMYPNATCKPALRPAGFSAAAVLFCTSIIAPLSALEATAQSAPSSPIRVYSGQPAGRGGDLAQPDELSDTQSIEFEKRMRRLNADRQKSLVADTARLLRLAQQLNDELAARAGDPTPAQLREIAEIEKLAHSVKSKMSISFRELTPSQEPIVPVR